MSNERTVAFQRRLFGPGNRIAWRAADIHRIAKRFGLAADDIAAVPRRAPETLPPTLPASVKAAGDGALKATFTISTAAVDRYGDTIAVAGWRLAHYKANPVVLYSHDSGSLPVGRAVAVWTEGGRLKSTVEIAGFDEFAARVSAMLEGGTLRASSVGFLPGTWKFSDDPARPYGIDFIDGHELLEWSICAVPANAQCLVERVDTQKSAAASRLRKARAILLRHQLDLSIRGIKT
jgi:HK97 family phage prohead protease